MTGLNKNLVKYRALYLNRMRGMNAGERQQYIVFRAGYAAQEAVTTQDSYRFAYLLSILDASESFPKAVEVASAEANIGDIRTADQMILAVNLAPEDWKNEHAESLYEKGLIRGTVQFFKAKNFLMKGNVFDRYREHIPENMREAMGVAIDSVRSPQNEYGLQMSPTTVCFLMAYMLPENLQQQILKEFEYQRKANSTIYEENQGKAWEALGVLVSAFDIPSSSLSPQAAQAKQDVRGNKETDELDGKLDGLGKMLSLHEKEVYKAYITHKTGNSLHDSIRVISLFSKSTQNILTPRAKVTPEFLRVTIEKVEKLLKGKPEPSKSDSAVSLTL